tara:strand:- start:3759 stop:5705 length:1947 start_codon:yes stop_codon:yes gene_type:complete
MEKTLTDFIPIEEGINDPAIFKAVFLAGGPGSGKSFMVGQTGLNSLGFKVVNSDQQFEVALKKAGMSQTPDDIFSTKGQSLRDRAKFVTAKRKSGFLDGRLGLVIDGTGRDYEKISKQKRELEKLGYETAMIMVNTSLQTAVGRDQARERTLGKDAITPMWKSVQQNIGKFSNLFKQNFFIVDNSDGADFKKGALSVYRNISAWSKRPPQKPIAQRWIKNQKKQRGIKEARGTCWVGYQQKGYKKKGNRMVPNCVKEDGTIDEKIKDMDMGEVITDFYRSDAPQFKGKSKKKRREMAIAAKLDAGGKGVSEDLRKWFGKGPKGDWVRVGTDGEIKGQCAREPGEGKPKCMPRSKAHSMSKDDRATSARRKRRKDPVADRAGKGGKPIMVKTDVKEDVKISRYEWGRPDGTAYMKAITPGQPGKTTKQNRTTNKYHYKAIEEEETLDMEVLEMDVDAIFTPEVIADMEVEVDGMEFDDLKQLDVFDKEELDDFDAVDELADIHDVVDILEVLTIQGRMKKRFAARRNRQKLKVARMRASRRAADPARIKKRATRGARNMIKARLARGRDISSLPPAEKSRLETMAKRFSGLVARIATRMMPVVRKAELKRLTNRKSGSSQKAKKFKPSKAGANASKQKSVKFKVKKVKR